VACAASLLALGCGGSSDGGDKKPGGGATVSGPMPTMTNMSPVTGGASNPASGSGGVGGSAMVPTPGGSGSAGMAAMQGGGMVPVTGGAAGMGMTPTTTEPKPVVVDPADVTACTGVGAAPDTTEQVDVIEVKTSDVVPGGFMAPDGTTYACFWVDIPMQEKQHIIGWEGAVGGDRAVHHQQVSLSAKPFYLTQQGGLCGLPTVDFTWTGEKPTEWTPKLAGFPIGGPDSGGVAHFLWQTHFEGATTYTGGFKVYVTKNLRKYDAGNFEQGDVAGIMIPAMSAATHVATCTPDMTKQKLPNPIYVYASMQHAHLTVTHIKSELMRDGATMQVLGDQAVMGFLGFFDQQFKPWTPCIEVRPGDQMVTTCDYMNNFNFDVVGGEAQTNEMCTTFMEYFPRLPGTSNNFCGTIDSTGGFTGM
jgi:hypothetical protein